MAKRFVVLTVGVVVVAGFLILATAGGCTDTKNPPTASAQTGGERMVKVENVKCPIMGDKLGSTMVPVAMTREYKGHELGFCCSDCPPKWDKLTETQKDAELAKVLNR